MRRTGGRGVSDATSGFLEREGLRRWPPGGGLLRRRDLVPKHTDTLQLEFEDVTGLQKPLQLRAGPEGHRARTNEVAGLQPVELGDVGDCLLRLPDEILDLGVGPDLAIDAYLAREADDGRDLVHGDDPRTDAVGE